MSQDTVTTATKVSKPKSVLQPGKEFVHGAEVKSPVIVNAPVPGDTEVKKEVKVVKPVLPPKPPKLTSEVVSLAKQSAGLFYATARRDIDYRKVSPEFQRAVANELIDFCVILVDVFKSRTK